METICGVVEHITYRNEENGFTVLKVKVREYTDLVTAVGSLATVNLGTILTLTGEWKMDSRYGRQLQVDRYTEELPAHEGDMEKYLGSGLIRGIGPVNAARLVRYFGVDTFRVIEETPDRLEQVPGIGPKRVQMICDAWQEHKAVKHVMMFLQNYGVSVSFGVRIYKVYGSNSISLIQENPYRLADDIWGIGFKTADRIARSMGYDDRAYARLRAGVIHTLNDAAGDGHCYLPREELIDMAAQILEVDQDEVAPVLPRMEAEESIHIETDGAVYVPTAFFSESGVARRIHEIRTAPWQSRILDVEGTIGDVEKEYAVVYDPVQKDAIRLAAESKFMILTGGPGTGKTTTVLGIMRVLEKMGARILLAAPTGRAAKRLAEATGKEARTIHRLLEFKPPQGYQRHEHNQLEGNVLIIDEASMIDIYLMYSLLKAVPDASVVIMVGDVDQLPSVGAGNVLRDMIDSATVPVVRLTRIFRQAAGSMIIRNAHRINQGDFPMLKNPPDADFFFIEESDPEKLRDLIVDLCRERIPRRYAHLKPTDIQVISPMIRGTVGVQHLNEVLQAALNPNPPVIRFGGMQLKVGDKVMQIRNNYDKDVFNGDIGLVQTADDERMTVWFEDREVPYERSELDEIVLAYAATVHKSQGSEYPVVIAPLVTQHYMMLQRNLLYTCITRAKQLMVLIGTRQAVAIAVRNNRVAKRNTRLAMRMKAFSLTQDWGNEDKGGGHHG